MRDFDTKRIPISPALAEEEFPSPNEREPDHSETLHDLRELALQGDLPKSAFPKLMRNFRVSAR